MRPIVQEWDEALRADVPPWARLPPEAEARGSILRPPATEQEVAAAEARLGVHFPPSYRSFLLISNGAEAGGYRANQIWRLTEPYREEILGAQDVVASTDAESLTWLLDMWRDNMQEVAAQQEAPSHDEPVQVFDFEPGARSLLVTRPVQDGIVALVPFPGEWQVWEFFHESVVAHHSFASFLAHHAREIRQAVARRAEKARTMAGDGSSDAEVGPLADAGDPRALEAGCRALLDPRHSYRGKGHVARVLMWLGDPAAIPALRSALASIDDRQSSSAGSETPQDAEVARSQLRWFLLLALDSCGDPEVLDELKRLAEGAPDGFAARHLSSRSELPRW